MKKILLISLLFSSFVYSQINVKTYYENTLNGYNYFADNNESIPVSIKISMKLTNLKSSKGNNKIFVIPANTKKFKLTELTTIKKGKYKVSGSNRFNYGIHNNVKYDKNFTYVLPFEKGQSFKIYQGYNGNFSHQNENSLDFSMPIGTNIVAVRDGVVVKIVQKNRKNCPKEECAKYNNLVIVYHNDGTFTEYVHLKQNSVKVKVGATVKQGQIIAKSGNTGWSTGPHLHLVIFNQNIEKRKTLKTKFKIDDGKKAIFLIEKKTYSKKYD